MDEVLECDVAVIGRDAGQGVVDTRHEVHGHPGLFVADASAIPVNLGVNPSLTITAMAERFAAAWPDKPATDKPATDKPATDKPATGNAAGGTAGDPPPRLSADLPSSPTGIRKVWTALPVPEAADLVGSHRAVFLGPRPARAVAPTALALIGLPGWFGKRFEAAPGKARLKGINLLGPAEDLVEYLEMTAMIESSVLDGAPVLVSTYGVSAPLPWRHVRDEFRLLSPGVLLGMAVLDLRATRRFGTPFALECVSGW